MIYYLNLKKINVCIHGTMQIKRFKNISKKKKKIFIYFYEEWCKNITSLVDTFFKEKYDLNKLYVKIKVTKSKDIIDYEYYSISYYQDI